MKNARIFSNEEVLSLIKQKEAFNTVLEENRPMFSEKGKPRYLTLEHWIVPVENKFYKIRFFSEGFNKEYTIVQLPNDEFSGVAGVEVKEVERITKEWIEV